MIGNRTMSDTPSSPHPSDSMRSADVANGERTDESTPDPGQEPTPTIGDDDDRAAGHQHRTGERQARENTANDPPA